MASDVPLTYLDGAIRLNARGEWSHDSVAFTNQKLIDLFHRSIVWDDAAKKFILQVGVYRAPFEYEDTVFFVLGGGH